MSLICQLTSEEHQLIIISVAVKPVLGECLFAEHTSDSSTNYSSSVLNWTFTSPNIVIRQHWTWKHSPSRHWFTTSLLQGGKVPESETWGACLNCPAVMLLRIEDLCGSISFDRGFGPSPFSTKLFNMWPNNTASLCHFSRSLINSEQHQNGSHRCPPQCRRIILVSDADRPLLLPPGLNFSHQYRGLFGDNSLNSATSQLTKTVPFLHYSWVPVPVSQDPDLLQEPLEAVLLTRSQTDLNDPRGPVNGGIKFWSVDRLLYQMSYQEP